MLELTGGDVEWTRITDKGYRYSFRGRSVIVSNPEVAEMQGGHCLADNGLMTVLHALRLAFPQIPPKNP
ncbi:MAG: hypothetical protein V4563_14820 [Pseudomonadota bacterium]